MLDNQQVALVAAWKSLGRDEQAHHAHPNLVERLSTLLRENNLQPLDHRAASESEGPSEAFLGSLRRVQLSAEEAVPDLKNFHPATPAAAATAELGPHSPNIARTPVPDPESGMPQQNVSGVGPTGRTYWKIEFIGRFDDVQHALGRLAEEAVSGEAPIPVRLTMDKARPELSLRRWTLVVCL